MADLGVGQHSHQSERLFEEKLLVEILGPVFTGLLMTTGHDVPGDVGDVQDTGGVRDSGHLVLLSPQLRHVGRHQLSLLPSEVFTTANTVSSRGQRDTAGLAADAVQSRNRF